MTTLWDIEPHTQAKHAILERYLQAWLAILTQQQRNLGGSGREILYVDGFAGPGEYSKGEPGSPIIAIKAALRHKQIAAPVRMLFIEEDEPRFNRLQTLVTPYIAAANAKRISLDVRHGDCETTLMRHLSSQPSRGVTLAFLDQFGYGEISMALIAAILATSECEVLNYLSYDAMNRWITDDEKAETFTSTFGGEEWRECVSLPPKERRAELLKTYKAALYSEGKAQYVQHFLMHNKDSKPLYWLFHSTRHIRGLEEMKKAMWKVDETGEYRFSDKDEPGQLDLLKRSYSQEWLADELQRLLGGQIMAAQEVKEFVLVETPCYLFKGALKKLELEQRLQVADAPAGRKPGTYPDDRLGAIKVRFEKSLLGVA